MPIIGRGTRKDRRQRHLLRDDIRLHVRLRIEGRVREPQLFNLGIDSKPQRMRDLVASCKVRDVCHGDQMATRDIVSAEQDPASGAIRNHTDHQRRPSVTWIKQAGLEVRTTPCFQAGSHDSPHLETRQYARNSWAFGSTTLDWTARTYGTHSTRRTKATLILPRRTKNLRSAIAPFWAPAAGINGQVPGIEVDDAPRFPEQTEIPQLRNR